VLVHELETLLLTGMVVKPEAAARNVGHVGQNVVVGNFDQTVLQILGVDEFVFVDDSFFDQQDGAGQAVKIRTRYEAHGISPEGLRVLGNIDRQVENLTSGTPKGTGLMVMDVFRMSAAKTTKPPQ